MSDTTNANEVSSTALSCSCSCVAQNTKPSIMRA